LHLAIDVFIIGFIILIKLKYILKFFPIIPEQLLLLNVDVYSEKY